MNILAALTGFYMLLIFIRIMLTWFGVSRYGRPVEILGRITDPYLLWWRRHIRLRTGALDLSPVAAMAALSIVHTVFSAAARSGSIRIGTILAIVLSACWSAASFILGFFIVVLILRFIAYMTNRNTYGAFWRLVDVISQPVLYRITRFFFRNRIVNYLSGIIFSIFILLVLYIAGKILVGMGTALLLGSLL
ncbi:MAG: YggT family protein [Treponema sp.]|nr:YggT family protein [Treponema sp.]